MFGGVDVKVYKRETRKSEKDIHQERPAIPFFFFFRSFFKQEMSCQKKEKKREDRMDGRTIL